ncbi:MAG: histidinol-phosphate transaminase [Nitrospirae bacterium]|nr:histidinol-phosphate transaminase [Nitrospirota bacterium]
MIKPLQYVSRIKPYVPGKPVKELERELGIRDSIKLASNENPLGPSPKALEAVKELLSADGGLNRYPDDSGYYLKNALSERLLFGGNGSRAKISSDEIILGNGSNSLIDVAVRTFMGPGDEAVMGFPSFVFYPIAVGSVGGVSIEVPLVDYRHDLTAMSDAITEKTKIVFIANPNNPTGTINKRDEIERFMERVPEGVLVVMDEAYYEYVRDSEYPDTLKYLREGRDILILRTFSKAYGLAGLRIGYGIAPKTVISEMDKIRGPFNTNSAAQVAALRALKDDEHLRRTIDINERGKDFLYKDLGAMGIRYVPTEANFIYMPLNIESKNIYNALLKTGVIIRTVGPKAIRVTVGLLEENRRFIESLKKIKEL